MKKLFGHVLFPSMRPFRSLVPRPHPQNGNDIRAFSWLYCVSSHVTTTRHAYGIRRTVLYVVSCVLLTQHNQENARMSPDPFRWGLGTGDKTRPFPAFTSDYVLPLAHIVTFSHIVTFPLLPPLLPIPPDVLPTSRFPRFRLRTAFSTH